jgi:arylsulfatase A-like enzyme
VGGAVARRAGWLAAFAALAGCGCGETGTGVIEAWRPSALLLARRADAVEWADAEPAARPPSFASFTDGRTSRFGVRLPPQTGAVWPLDLPAGAVLAFAVSAPAAGAAAAVAVELSEDQELWTELVRETAPPGRWASRRIDLANRTGRAGWIRFRALPGPEGGEADVRLAEPAIFLPQAQPRRVLLVFVDTLRPDHLGLYGYARDTSPGLDAFARGAAVFETARAPSPWTLPSARAALSGRHAERWDEGANLAERLAEAGFATLATTSNAFLGPAFRMERGWSEYEVHNKRPAGEVVDRALALLERHADRDLLLLAHFMDPHLPYREPPAYRHVWADPQAEGDEEYRRVDLMAIDPGAPEFAPRRRDVVDRYDQTIRYLDDELARLFEAVGPDATVVFFSDHGEEFWDHGGVEHGHSFFEELLRIPLALRDRHLPSGRFRFPVSLLDIAPTLLALLGLDAAGFDGRSLLAAARADREVRVALEARPEVFGNPLYGADGWAVRLGARKWISRGGRQLLFDLSEDPGEAQDLAVRADAALGRYPAALDQALGRPVRRVWRVVLRAPVSEVVRFQLTHPAGIERVWVADDPREEGGWAPPQIVDGGVRLTKAADERLPRALYLLPAGDPDDPRGLRARFETGDGPLEESYAGGLRAFEGGAVPPLLRAGDARRGFLVVHAHAPFPTATPPAILPDEVRKALEELGYLE